MGDGRPKEGKTWRRLATLGELTTPWVKVMGERLLDDAGRELDYWRVEKSHSAVVLPLCDGEILLPPPSFRPGLGRATLDLPGGRMAQGQGPEEAARAVLMRELGAAPGQIESLTLLNPGGWPVNSSFSNQLLYGLVAVLSAGFGGGRDDLIRFGADGPGVDRLLAELDCLQCRAVVLEWRPAGPA